jgi:ferric-dicitrate binding protein FerR (iron transport regulator)
MRWLEGSKDECERRLRGGLDAARERTDDLALRRIWSRLAEPELLPGGRRWPWLLGLGGVAIAMSAAAAVVFFVPANPSPIGPVAETRSAPEAKPRAEPTADATPEVVGPALVRTGAHQRKNLRLRGGARVELDVQTVFAVDAGQRPAVQQGRARLEVPRQPKGERFTVAVGPYVIVVVGTVFDVGLSQGTAAVDVTEGVVEVWRDGDMVRVPAGRSWRGPAPSALSEVTATAAPRSSAGRRGVHPSRRAAPEPVAELAAAPPEEAPPPEPMRPSDRFRVAKAALASGETERGMSILWSLAEGSGPVAENAFYEVGRALRDQLTSPREAIAAWSRYRARFPRGLLRAEADISILETLLALGDREAALREASAFLQLHPRSERRAEVARLVERLRQTLEARAPGTIGGR